MSQSSHVVLWLLLSVGACQSAPEATPVTSQPAPVTPEPPPTAEQPPPRETASDESPVLITDPSQREAAVGKRVTIVGIQTRTKIPQVNGVDVDGDYALSDQEVRVEGILRKRVVEPRSPDEPVIATRGPGTYYFVVDPGTGKLARPLAR